jgi:hypothetical protein
LFSQKLGNIAGGINNGSQVGCVYCKEICKQDGALCERLFDISDIGGEKFLKWPSSCGYHELIYEIYWCVCV